MAYSKTAVTPLLTHWSYCSLALDHRYEVTVMVLQRRHNERDGISNHRRLYCLFNCWFRRRSTKTLKLRVTSHWPLCGEVAGIGKFPYKRPITRKMFPFDDVIMGLCYLHPQMYQCRCQPHRQVRVSPLSYRHHGPVQTRSAEMTYTVSVSKIKEKYLHVRRTSYFWALRSFQMFTGLCSRYNIW